MNVRFRDRSEAGRLLADLLESHAAQPESVILGLPRGGTVVAFEVARRWRRSLHAFVVRKLGVPMHEELAMGAIASGGIIYLNSDVLQSLRISPKTVDKVTAGAREEMARQEKLFQTGPTPNLGGRVVILIDDGLATGATMRAAVRAARSRQPARVVVAVPVAAAETALALREEVDDFVCVQCPPDLGGVGEWYEDFSQTTDDEVRALLTEAAAFRPSAPEPKLQQEAL